MDAPGGRYLEIAELDVHYGGIQALTGIGLHVDKGEIVAVIGANGAGKSTLLNTVSGFLRPTSGYAEFKGERIGRIPSRVVKAGICHVPEGRLVFANLTVQDNLVLGAYLRRDRRKIAADFERFAQAFALEDGAQVSLYRRARPTSLQVALFVTPILVLGSLLLGHPMTLVFSAVEVIAVTLAVALTGLVTLNGETNWLEGVQLLALYVILAICLALLPAGEALRTL